MWLVCFLVRFLENPTTKHTNHTKKTRTKKILGDPIRVQKTILSPDLKTCTPYFLLFFFGCNNILVQAKRQGKAVNLEQAPEQPDLRTPRLSQKHTNRLTIIGIILTVAGMGLFAYFVYSVGVGEIVNNISRFGVDGFAIIVALYRARQTTHVEDINALSF